MLYIRFLMAAGWLANKSMLENILAVYIGNEYKLAMKAIQAMKVIRFDISNFAYLMFV